MLRVSRALTSKPLTNLTLRHPVSAITSQYQYSSEPPDQLSAKRPVEPKPRRVDVDVTNAFYRKTGPELKLFGPQDMRAPLNGNIGLADDTNQLEIQAVLKLIDDSTQTDIRERRDKDWRQIRSLLSEEPQTRCHKFFQILKYQKLIPKEMVCVTKSSDTLDCSAHDLPLDAIQKFASLFAKPKRLELNSGLTVITITKKTDNDMTSYSQDVELEREAFFEQFVEDAQSLCKQLHRSGYWADFIDPYSGQPFMVSYSTLCSNC